MLEPQSNRKQPLETVNDTNLTKIALLLLAASILGVVGWQTLAGSSDGGSTTTVGNSAQESSGVPAFLERSFPNTDFSDSATNLNGILSGGPGKDGIPSVDNPEFIPIDQTSASDDVQAIVVEKVGGQRRAYPYNILNWHEIVNDEVDGTPIAVTFCPLCGSAVVYNRNTPAGVSEFGVSGALIEGNMVMYDRLTESLWQQSTGVSLAGEQRDAELELEPFQLLSVGEIKNLYPNAEIMTDDTGISRDYNRNPYSGYDEDDSFIFDPSTKDNAFPLKEIFAITNHEELSVAIQWLELEDGVSYTVDNGVVSDLTVTKENGELKIVTETGEELPFYFEMWFSWAVQHQDQDPSKVTIFSPTETGAGQ